MNEPEYVYLRVPVGRNGTGHVTAEEFGDGSSLVGRGSGDTCVVPSELNITDAVRELVEAADLARRRIAVRFKREDFHPCEVIIHAALRDALAKLREQGGGE